MAPEAETIAGMQATGRRIAAPALDLVELVASNGLKHLAMAHRETWHGHPRIGADLQPRLGFMEQPDTTGIARLVAHDPESGAFVYPTGTVWTVAEVVRSFADSGAAAGVKAGLELCYLVAESLVDAAEASAAHGMVGHGNVNPWTVLLKGDGQPVVLGYGIPQVELAAWREDNRLAMVEDSFRYAPPERIDGAPEDLSSDLFSLALVALEVMVGRPVYDGVLADVRQQASRGEGMRRLYQWRERLPQNVREVLGRALKPDPDTRYPNGLELVYAVHDLLGSIDVEGPSLMEVMAKVRASQKRGRALKGGQTAMLSAEEVAEMAADLAEIEERPLKPPRRPRPEADAGEGERPRWSKPARRSAGTSSGPPGAPSAPPRPPPGPPAGASAPRRRMRQPTPEAASIDLTEPDDVELEIATHTGGHRSPVGPPEPRPVPARPGSPGGDDTGLRKSAAAALLEKLRTSGDRRRRLRPEADGRGPSPTDAVEGPRPGSVPTPPPAATRTAPPPPPRAGEPAPPRADDVALPPRRMVDVTWGAVRVSLPWRTGERPASLALRAAFAMGGYPVDPLGRPLGGPRIHRNGAPMPPDEPVEPGEYELVVVAAEVRRVEVQVRIDPPLRFQTLVSTAIPIGWVVGGLVRLSALPPGDWAALVDGVPVDGDRLALDVLGSGASLVIGSSRG